MKNIIPGHKYVLANFEDQGNNNDNTGQTVQFIQKELSMDGVTFETVANGTTNEEVIVMLLDRLNFLNQKMPCRENSVAITHLETALLWLQSRTKNRERRGVEGTPNP